MGSFSLVQRAISVPKETGRNGKFRFERLVPARRVRSKRTNVRNSMLTPARNEPAMPLRNRSNTTTVVTVERSSTGKSGAPLLPVDERPPTSLELLRQLEVFVRENFEISEGG
jgi:hypothetical protein